MIGYKFKLDALTTASRLGFDDELHGQFVGVKYTHHESMKFDGTIGEPLYLALDLREKDGSGEPGRALSFYLVGSANATSWIKEVDERIREKLNLTNYESSK